MITKYQSLTVGSIEAVMCQWGIVAWGQEFWIQMTTLPFTSIIIFLNFFSFYYAVYMNYQKFKE